MKVDRDAANKEALRRLMSFDPWLVDVQPAIDAVPGMRANMVLVSGPPTPWSEFEYVQRQAILQGAVYEGLAASFDEAAAKLDAGEILLEPTQAHGCVGAATGIFTASMPVYVVENRAAGTRAYSAIVEGNPPRVFAFGTWGDDIVERLDFIRDVYAPVIRAALRRTEGGIPLKPIMRRAIPMGDEVHFRNDAGTLLFLSALIPHLLDVAREREADVRRVIQFIQTTPVTFLRVAIAGAKSALDAATGVEGSSMVTGIIHNCKAFAVRVSGLGDQWFLGGFPEYLGEYFWGSGPEDICWAGGESFMMECTGFGGMLMASALSLQNNGPVEARIERNRQMYEITLGQNPEFKIPYFDRGAPVGIDVLKVVDTGIRPFMQSGLVRKDGQGSCGLGPMVLNIEPFAVAAAAYRQRYGA